MANFYSMLNVDNPLMDVYTHRNDVTGDDKGDPIPELGDNNYNTTSSVASIKINIDTKRDGTGDAREFTHIFVKCNNVVSYAMKLTTKDTTDPTMFVTAAVPNFTNMMGPATFTRTGSYQHNLYGFTDLLPIERNVQSITLDFTPVSGGTVEIVQILVLTHRLFLDSEGFTDISPEFRDRTGGIHEAMDGTESRYETLGTRDKIEVEYDKPIIVGARELQNSDGTFIQPIDFVNTFQRFTHTHKNFVFEREYHRTFAPTANTWSRFIDYSKLKYMHKETGALLPEIDYILDGPIADTELLKDYTPTEVFIFDADGNIQYYKVGFDTSTPLFMPLKPKIGTSPPGTSDDNWVSISPGEQTVPTPKLVFPDLLYPAIFKNLELPTPFWSDVKINGYSLEFMVSEN